jgi:hypothetical protein
MNTIQHRRRRVTALAAVPLLLLALSACSPQSSAGDEENPSQGSLQWRLDFAECMRGQGIDMEDPAPNGAVPATGPEDETPERQAATEFCLEELGTAPAQPGGETEQQVHEDQLAIAKCLREQGIDVADPEPGGSLVLPEDVSEEVAELCGVDATDAVAPQ